MRADHYDGFAAGYARSNDANLFNAHYERPAMLRLVDDVEGGPAGRRVLDAGCGSGPLARALRERGAVVSGFDGSPAMVALARERLGDAAGPVDLRVADLAAPLPWPDAAFDDVVCSLVLHYLPDWTAPLAELRRVLRPGGRLLVSVNHPLVHPFASPDSDYFALSEHSDTYDFDGEPGTLTYWHRPLHAMAAAFTGAGFTIATIDEPPYDPATPAELLPPGLGERSAFLCFLFWVLEAR